MTEFQAACLAAVAELLQRKGKACEPIRISGLHEDYYRLEISSSSKVVDLHVYEDEAGYFVNRRWYIRESQDYGESQELVERLLEDLERELSSGDAEGAPD